ncbi:Fic family protein [Streptomyces acidiscabies]|uniref:Cell filamentation protein Fic n=1 Tax=Streptomyces acidiscabies TaxID=42234 RepID=A0A0L0K781_9ACTN|nr:Fic family protein [Streptomyces acidiscabies]KND33962.1 cell filamentation protein Fic [Streptomyces acidiscabies]
MLFKTPGTDATDDRVLTEITAMREDLRIHLRPTSRWTKQLRRNLTARAIAGSNSIEGYDAKVDDVEAMIQGEQPLDTEETSRKALEGYQRAMSYIQDLSDAGSWFRYDHGLLNGLHRMINEHDPSKRPGRYREGPVYITDPDDPTVHVYEGPEKDEAQALMGELIDWLNEGDLDAPTHIRASMAHLNLVKIHPWKDGNGRMSRSLSTLVFSREALVPAEFSSIEEWLGRGVNTYAYYRILERVGGHRWSPQRDAHPWIKFCLGAHHMQAQQAKRRVDVQGRVWIRLAEEMEAAGLDERMVAALSPVYFHTRLRRTMYQQDAELNERTSKRDIQTLVDLGWLESQGQARGRYYTAGPLMEPVRKDIRMSTEPLKNPYGRGRH